MARRGNVALEALRVLDGPGEVAAAPATTRRGRRLTVNSHIHLPPNFSAFDGVREAVDCAARDGIEVLGASNYYDFAVYDEFAAETRRRGMFPLFGVEVIALDGALEARGVRVNDPGNPGKMYVCGKGITRFERPSREARRLIARIRANDAERMRRMIEKMNRAFAGAGVDVGLDESVVIDGVVRRTRCAKETVTLQERHVARALQEAVFERVEPAKRLDALGAVFGAAAGCDPSDAASVQNEIRAQLMKAGKPAFVEERFVTFEEAARLVLELGGVVCYPTLADGAKPVCAFEEPVEALIENMAARGVYFAEFIPGRNDAAVLEHYVRAMRGAGIVVTAGTEHNTLERFAMRPKAAGGAEIPEEAAGIFREGARVAAAHEYLSARGGTGFVDGEGNLNDAYGGREQLIGAMDELGAAVIERYRETAGFGREGGS